MARFIDFNEIQPQKNGGTFLKVKPDCKLKVRLIGTPVEMAKVYGKDRKCVNLDDKETGKRLKAKYPKELSDVSIRYVNWCIDRDSKSMKILDMPYSVAKAFCKRALLVGKKIDGGDEGCDWMIMTNGRQGKDVRYETVYLEETPLSNEEKKMVEDQKSDMNGRYDLCTFFKSHSFEEAEAKLFG